MIKFIDGAEVPVGNLIVVIYGAPCMGKTTLALTAEDVGLFDFDGGAYRAGNKAGKAILPVKSWQDVAAITADDLKDFKTIVVDTVGTALDHLSADIIRADPKNGPGGTLSRNGYGVLKSRFAGWLAGLKSDGKGCGRYRPRGGGTTRR